jgi:hypothetical protein
LYVFRHPRGRGSVCFSALRLKSRPCVRHSISPPIMAANRYQTTISCTLNCTQPEQNPGRSCFAGCKSRLASEAKN